MNYPKFTSAPKLLLYSLWLILLLAGIYLFANSYLKEVELINQSARLELLETSFNFHPKLTTEDLDKQESLLYVYLFDEANTLLLSYERSPEITEPNVQFSEDDLNFKRYSTSQGEVLKLTKVLRRGREEGGKQSLIIGMDYTPYQIHEYRSFLKYLILFIAVSTLIALLIINWRRWLNIQAQMVENEHFIYTGKLSRQIAHEIKNPLGVMQATIDYLKELNDPLLIKAELIDIGSEIQRLNRLVERIRSFAQNEQPESTAIHLGHFLQTLEGRIKHCYPELVGSYDHTTDLLIHADQDQLTQVLLNLIQNAQESYSTPEDSKKPMILLGMTVERKKVEIYVQDWGDPIPYDIQDRLFHPFITSKSTGTGLGLSISRQIVQAHGGDLTLSISDNSKRFSVFLPLLDENQESR